MIRMDEVKNAMNVLGITDIHVEFTYVKKVHRKLLLKWHPDSCPEGKAEEYTKKSAEINAAFDVLEKAYKVGMMGPGAKDFRETSNEKTNNKTKTSTEGSHTYTNNANSHNGTNSRNSTNNNNSNNSTNRTHSTGSNNNTKQNNAKRDNTTNTYSNNYQSQNMYDTYYYYSDMCERQRREHERKEEKRRHSRFLLHNAVWNYVFYSICIKQIYRTLMEADLEYKNMLIKETPYYFSVLIVVFYLLKLMYSTYVLDAEELDPILNFCKTYVPIAFVYPIIYTFMHGVEAAIIFSLYLAGWAVFEWMMNIRIYENLDRISIGPIKGKKISLPLIFFGLGEAITTAFGIYVAIAAIFIK